MKQPKRISVKVAQDRAIDRMLSDVPEADRGLALLALIRSEGGLGSMSTHFENCPACGHYRLPVEAHSGQRRCRNCGHYGRSERAVA